MSESSEITNASLVDSYKGTVITLLEELATIPRITGHSKALQTKDTWWWVDRLSGQEAKAYSSVCEQRRELQQEADYDSTGKEISKIKDEWDLQTHRRVNMENEYLTWLARRSERGV